MTSAQVTRRALTLGARDSTTGLCAKNFATETIDMIIQPRGASFRIGDYNLYAQYPQTGLSPASDYCREDDEVIDVFGNYFLVKSSELTPWLNKPSHSVYELAKQTEHTDRAATSGTWHTDYENIKTDVRYRTKLWLDTYLAPTYTATSNGAADGTTIINTSHVQPNDYFNGRTVTMLTGTCAGETAVVSDYALTTGTITLAGAGFSAQIDAADTYTISNILKDDGVTAASYVVMFAKPDYSLRREFIDNAIDVIAYVNNADSQPETATDRKPYCFRESVSIRICAINKTDVTATNLAEQFEQEIRRVSTEHPTGSIRKIEIIKNSDEDLGGVILYSRTVMLNYKRANNDYQPAYPTVSYGEGFIYEGDRVAGGTEGTWAETEDGSTGTFVVDSESNIHINISAAAGNQLYHITNGTHLNLSSDIYTKIRYRYKTSGTVKPKIELEFSDATGQVILDETASATWATGEVTITPTKTIDHIWLEANHGTGDVYYDFNQIYKGRFTFPNIVEMTPPLLVNDAVIDVPGRWGSIDQALGGKSMEVTTVHDLDIEPALLTWKRPQATTPKTDYNKIDVLLDLAHYGGINQLWHWLDLGDPTIQMKARLVSVESDYKGESNLVRLTWREYRHGGAEGETAVERWMLNQ